MKRQFIQIPIEIWNLDQLHPNERVLLAEVMNFEKQGKECFASNEHFADLLNVSEATARGYISKLVNAGFLVREGDRYNRRLRKSTQTNAQNSADECVNPRKRVRKSTQTSAQNSAHNRIDNRTVNRTIKKDAHTRVVVLPFQTDSFESAWNEWKEYKRTDHRFKYKTAQSEQRALMKLQNEHPEETDAINAIHTAITNGWKGLVFGKSTNGRINGGRAKDLKSDFNREKFRELAETGRITTDRRNVF